MSIAKIKLDESTKLEFGVNITGAEGAPQARFVIEGSDFSLSYPCHKLDEGGIQVSVGNLEHILKAGEYPVRLEVVIENKIFTPFEDTIIFEPNVHVTTKPKAVTEIKESITIDKVVVTVDNSVKEKLAKDTKLATLIAETVKHDIADYDASPEVIINESLANRTKLAPNQKKLLIEMLKQATKQEIGFDVNLLSPKK